MRTGLLSLIGLPCLVAFGCAEDAAAPGAPDAAPPDARPADLGPAPCVDDRYGFGTLELPAASLGLGREAGLVLCDAEGDVFAVDAPAGLAVGVAVEAPRPVRLTAYGGEGALAEAEGRNPLIQVRNPAGGLRVVVAPAVPGPPIGYALVVGLAPTTCDDPNEPDGPTQPRPLGARRTGVVCAGEEDWLAVAAPAGAVVEVRVERLGGQGVAVARVEADTEILDEVEVTDSARLSWLASADGVHLRLRPLGPGAGWAASATVDAGGLAAGTLQGLVGAFDRPTGPDGLGAPAPRVPEGAWVEAIHAPTGLRAGQGRVAADGTFAVAWAAPTDEVAAQVVARVGAVAVGPPGAAAWSAPTGALTPDEPTAAALHVAAVADAALDALRPYFEADAPAPLRIDWRPGQRPACGTCYRPETGHVELSGAEGDHDEWDDGVILHEVGHHVAAAHGRDDSPGGRHDGDRTWPALAWSEGLATFHAAFQLGGPQVGDLRPTGYQVIDLETLEDPRAYGTDDGTLGGDVSELLVAAVLWDLLDGGPGDDDAVSVPAEVLWPALLGGLASYAGDEGAPGLDLVDALAVLARVVPEADLAAVVAARGLSWP